MYPPSSCRLAASLLSSQPHYDWSLRSLKRVVGDALLARQAEVAASPSKATPREAAILEQSALLAALRSATRWRRLLSSPLTSSCRLSCLVSCHLPAPLHPRLLQALGSLPEVSTSPRPFNLCFILPATSSCLSPNDAPAFDGLLADLFGSASRTVGTSESPADAAPLPPPHLSNSGRSAATDGASATGPAPAKTMVSLAIFEAGELEPTASFVRNVSDLDALLAVRRSVLLLGPPGAGKTAVARALQAAVPHLRGALTRHLLTNCRIHPFTHVHASYSTQYTVDPAVASIHPARALSTGSSSPSFAVVCPRTLSHEELYGAVHASSGEAVDGVLPRLLRRAFDDTSIARAAVPGTSAARSLEQQR